MDETWKRGVLAVPGLADTHCHLNHPQFDADRDEAIARARAAGVKRLLVIGYDLASSRAALSLAQREPDMQAVIGIHPESAHEWPDAAPQLIAMLAERGSDIAAWGEIGLDYHWESVARDRQQQVFEEQLAVARENDLPVVVHCRDAYSDVIGTLERLEFRRAVLHCFTGTIAEARRAAAMGLYIGVGGIATFKKSDDLRAVIAELPRDRILIETDSPYLAPQRWRGKRNEPAYVTAVAELLGELWNEPADEVARITSANAGALFGSVRH